MGHPGYSLKAVSQDNFKTTLFVYRLSIFTFLCCLMFSVLKAVVPYVLSYFSVVWREDGKSGLYNFILAENINSGLLSFSQ